MGLQLIIGASGAGKSRLMYSQLIRNSISHTEKQQGRCYAIVPEQFTMETQKTIVELSETHGTMSIDIVSFQRLAKRIFDEAGLSTVRVLDDTGKCLILRKIIEENKDKFTVFGSKAGMSGFIEEMKSMISELYQYGITDEKFDQMLLNVQKRPLLYAKLQDIKLISERLREYLNDRFIMNEELLQRVCALIGESEIMRDSYITLDEYTGFSPVQYEVIRGLLKCAKEVSVTITLRDADKVDYQKENDADIFNLSLKTINRLKTIAKEENVEVYSDIVLTESLRLKENAMISYLEKNIFKYGVKPYKMVSDTNVQTETGKQAHSIANHQTDIKAGSQESEQISNQINRQVINKAGNPISIHICDNPIAEAEYVAYTIRQLVSEENYRYRDIAVVTADIANYNRTITEMFAKHEVPCFVDDKRSVIANPMVETIRAALEIVSDHFSYESVFRYLRCGMSSLPRHEIDLLENYVITHGIRGRKKWLMSMEEAGEEYETARQKVMADILELYDTFKSKRRISVKTAIAALYQLVIRLDIERKLEVITRHFYDEGDVSRGNEFKQTFGLVTELFDKTVFLIGEEEVNAEELMAMLDSGFEDIKVGLVPPTLDRVVVGDIERTRLNKVKVLFLIGANDGMIPKSDKSAGVLTREERNYLYENGVELSPTARENAFIQKFYLYLMLTKMSDRLYLSFTRSGGDGSSQRPSYIISVIVNMFQGISVFDEAKSDLAGLPKNITNIKSAVSYVSKNMHDFISGKMAKEEEKVFCELYTTCIRHQIDMKPLIHAAVYSMKQSRLDKAVARTLYGENMHNTVSRLETFASCAYRHFLIYGLQLVERKEYGVQRNDIGNVYHSAIELFFKKVREKKLSFDSIDDAQRRQLINESVSEAAVNDIGVFNDTGRNAYILEKIKKVSDKTVWILQQQINAGKFLPSEFEMRFSSDRGLDRMKYIYEDGAQMGLRGVIDRVDYYQEGDDIYVKIIDYKSGNKKFEINDVYNGLQLQLVVYMEAALELTKKKYPDKNVIPAGMFYYNIDDPVIKADSLVMTEKESENRKAIDEAVLKQQKINGLVSEDENVLKAFDSHLDELKDSGRDSLYVPVGFTKKGAFKNTSSQTDAKSMQCMLDYVHGKTGEFGKEILDGNISINPYRKVSGGSTPCDYCEFGNVCGFDKNVNGARYRLMYKDKAEEVWSNIRKSGNGNEEDHVNGLEKASKASDTSNSRMAGDKNGNMD